MGGGGPEKKRKQTRSTGHVYALYLVCPREVLKAQAKVDPGCSTDHRHLHSLLSVAIWATDINTDPGHSTTELDMALTSSTDLDFILASDGTTDHSDEVATFAVILVTLM